MNSNGWRAAARAFATILAIGLSLVSFAALAEDQGPLKKSVRLYQEASRLEGEATRLRGESGRLRERQGDLLSRASTLDAQWQRDRQAAPGLVHPYLGRDRSQQIMRRDAERLGLDSQQLASDAGRLDAEIARLKTLAVQVEEEESLLDRVLNSGRPRPQS